MHAAIRSVCEDSEPCQAVQAFDLSVHVGDGVRGFSRLVNVLALLEITPLQLSAAADDGEMEVTAVLATDGRSARLGLERLRVLPCVRSARLALRTGCVATSPAPVC